MHLIKTDLHDQILDMEYPKDGKLRVRKVISRSKARPTGKYPSWKMGRMIHWESSHELNAFRLLDGNPAVVSFHEQPLAIHFVLNGEKHTHYPDTLVNLGATRELWEIKPTFEAAKPEFIARTRFLQGALPQKGFTYRMVIGEDLACEPRLSTVLALLKYGRQAISLVEREQVRRILTTTGGICWGSATAGDLGARGRYLLSRLALEGALKLDFETRLCPETLFTPALPESKGV